MGSRVTLRDRKPPTPANEWQELGTPRPSSRQFCSLLLHAHVGAGLRQLMLWGGCRFMLVGVGVHASACMHARTLVLRICKQNPTYDEADYLGWPLKPFEQYQYIGSLIKAIRDNIKYPRGLLSYAVFTA